MDLIKKKEIESFIGKKRWSAISIYGKLKYVSGIDALDSFITTYSSSNPCLVSISQRDQGIELQALYSFKRYCFCLKNDEILEIILEESDTYYSMKKKSVLGRALIGGIFLGPVGAIVGGISGMGEKKVINKSLKFYLIIVHKKTSEKVVFSLDSDNIPDVTKFFESLYPDIFYKKKYINPLDKKTYDSVESLLSRYLANANDDKKMAIFFLFDNKDNFFGLEDGDLSHVEKYIVDSFENLESNYKKNNDVDGIDNFIEFKNSLLALSEFLEDLKKIYQLLNRQGSFVNYRLLLYALCFLMEFQYNENFDKFLNCIYIRVTNILGSRLSVYNIIREILYNPFDILKNEASIKNILNRFGLFINDDELINQIQIVQRDIELDDFEKSMKGNKNEYLPDYSTLDGYQFEVYLKKLFESLGYVVINTPLSQDQGADLILGKDGIKVAVQAKNYSGKVSNKAIQEAVAAKGFYNCDSALVVITSEFTKSAIELALKNGVELWDKKKLDSEIESLNKSSSGLREIFDNVKLEENIAVSSCPFCFSELRLDVGVLPVIHERKEFVCSSCCFSFEIEIPDELYTCSICNLEFNSIKDMLLHESSCNNIDKF